MSGNSITNLADIGYNESPQQSVGAESIPQLLQSQSCVRTKIPLVSQKINLELNGSLELERVASTEIDIRTAVEWSMKDLASLLPHNADLDKILTKKHLTKLEGEFITNITSIVNQNKQCSEKTK